MNGELFSLKNFLVIIVLIAVWVVVHEKFIKTHIVKTEAVQENSSEKED